MCFCGIIHTTKAKKTKPKTEDKNHEKDYYRS
nr:MAG TPA: hypothetical protein [Caudoviricetes sp.]